MGFFQLPDSLSTNTGSNARMGQLSAWIRGCDQNHRICRWSRKRPSTDYKWLPRRLVDLSTFVDGDGSLVVRLVETATDPLPSDRRYISRSYYWGSSSTFRKLEVSSVQSLKNGWAANRLCQTFQDAFAASTRIGVKLIWIDALCIIREEADRDA